MRRIAPSRMRQLEERLHPAPDAVGRLVICCLERWPLHAQEAWAAACAAGDRVQQEDLVERYEGVRPKLGGPHISLILVPPPDEEGTGTRIDDL